MLPGDAVAAGVRGEAVEETGLGGEGAVRVIQAEGHKLFII